MNAEILNVLLSEFWQMKWESILTWKNTPLLGYLPYSRLLTDILISTIFTCKATDWFCFVFGGVYLASFKIMFTWWIFIILSTCNLFILLHEYVTIYLPILLLTFLFAYINIIGQVTDCIHIFTSKIHTTHAHTNTQTHTHPSPNNGVSGSEVMHMFSFRIYIA